MLTKWIDGALAMTTRRQYIRPLRTATPAVKSQGVKKDVKKNESRLPKIQDSAKNNSQNSCRASLPVAALRHKESDDKLLARCLSRLHVHSRRFSYRSGTDSLTVEGIASFIRNRMVKSIVVMAGAGISTPSGIPDFRSPGTGLYDNLKQYKIPYPEAIFDIDYFRLDPRPFFALAKELYPNGKYRPNYVHHFLRLLHDRGLLLRLYTQNIDGLERSAGIPPIKLVEAHGTFTTASCTRCKTAQSSELVRAAIFNDTIPRCHDTSCRGVVKPDIVFFGEDLPQRFFLHNKDFHEADLLIVLGTSLEVEPFAGIVDAVHSYVPRLLFNRDLVGPFRLKRRRESDVASTGDITEQVKEFVELLGWTKDLEELISRSETSNKQVQDCGIQFCDSVAKTNPATGNVNTRKSDGLSGAQVKNGFGKSNAKETTNPKPQKNSSTSNKTGNNNRTTPFHAQKELYRTNGKTIESDSSSSEDSVSLSSDEEPRK